MTENRTARWFRRFAEVEARGHSAIYEAWGLGVAADPQLFELIERLPEQKRHPPLLFAVTRLLGAPVGPFPRWRDWLIANWPSVESEARERYTQTNEPRRCATLLPALAQIDGPIALLEVGASAGLCLYPDRYSYRFGDGHTERVLHPASGPSEVLLDCETTGDVVLPTALPEIVWRAGIDLEPLDLASDVDTNWLETLVWPEQHERLERLRGAIRIVRDDPPLIVRGSVTDVFAELAAQAPAEATLVVVTSGVLVYVPGMERQRFVDTVTALDARWISLEGASVLTGVGAELPAITDLDTEGRFVLALDGHPLAFVGPHGQSIEWLAPQASGA